LLSAIRLALLDLSCIFYQPMNYFLTNLISFGLFKYFSKNNLYINFCILITFVFILAKICFLLKNFIFYKKSSFFLFFLFY